MITDWARARTRSLLKTIALFFNRFGLTPNLLTLIGFLLVCAIALVIALVSPSWGGVMLVLALAFDATDGALARITNRVSRFGGFFDSVLDRWSDGVLMLAVAYRGLQSGNQLLVLLAIVALIGAFVVSYTRARAGGLGIEMKEGLFTRLERTIILVLGLILSAVFGDLSLIVAVAVLAVFSNFTAVQRVVSVYHLLK